MSNLAPGADALVTLVHELSKLPGIGEKSATRLAYHLLNAGRRIECNVWPMLY